MLQFYSIAAIILSDQSRIDNIYVSRDISNGFILKPGQFVLCTLNETLDLPDSIVAHVMPRTRFTRLGLLVSPQRCCAGYSGQLQVGVQNVTGNNVSIVEGLALAQIEFEKLESVPSESRIYSNRKNATYQDEHEFRGAILTKTPLRIERKRSLKR